MQAYAAFRYRDYRFLAVANLVSTLSIQMLSLAVSWDLYIATRSPLVLGNVGLVQVAPFLFFALFAGQIADRHDRRRVMLITQAFYLVAALGIMFSGRSVPIIYACLFVASTARAFQGPARLAVLPAVVPTEHLGNAITWNSSVQELASVSGPALAGILLAASGSRIVYLLVVLCALAVLMCFGLLRFPRRPAADPEARHSIGEGLRFLWRDRLILSASSLDMFAVLFGGATALLPIYSVEILHGGVHTLGWLRAAPSVGAVAMALVLAHSPRIRSAGRVMLWAVAGFGVATIVFGLSRSIWLSFLMLVITGACDNISVVLRHSLIQHETPDEMRGRVLSVNNIFISCSNQLGAVESGLTAAWFGAVMSVAAGGAATLLVVATYAKFARRLRDWRQ